MIGCSDICEEVQQRLMGLGFQIDTVGEDHDDMMTALAQVRFVREEVSVADARCAGCGWPTATCACIPVEDYGLG